MRITNLIGSLVLAVGLLSVSFAAEASPTPRVGFVVSVRIAPPVLPVYVQPLCPGPGYIWEPGYWAYGDDGYYWVPGVWVFPPRAGLLWTPGYWRFSNGVYMWSAGYWGLSVGFYGGINYGFGYPGRGFYGGYWRGGQYFYNTRVTNVNMTIIHNVYTRNVVNDRSSNRVSFNGSHGVTARPTSAELSAARRGRVSMTSAQMQHQRSASSNRMQLASVNHGRPDVAASARPSEPSPPREAPNKGPANIEPPAANNRSTAPAQPERSVHKTAPATRPGPARSEKSTVHQPAPTHSPAPEPTHPDKASAPHPASAPGPAASHSERPAAHQPAQPKPAPRKSTPPPSPKQSPSNAHTAPHPSQQHAAAPHASAPRPTTNEQSNPNDNKPQHRDH